MAFSTSQGELNGNSRLQVATPHLFAAMLACILVASILAGGRAITVSLERKTLPEIAPQTFQLKDQGLAFQEAAANAPGILPLYGSSELVHPAENKPADFFRSAPTGFQVSPIGAGGVTSIIILQKLAALAPTLEGKKIAISLSPSWFFRPTVNSQLYNGNFSPRAASEMVFSSALGPELKRAIGSRMLQFPNSLARVPLLRCAINCLVSRRPLDRALFWGLWPLGKLQNATFDLQDHFAALTRIAKSNVLRHQPTDTPKNTDTQADTSAVNGPETGNRYQAPALDDEIRRGGDSVFLAHMSESMEWSDFELLLRTLTEIHARPLLLCIPLDGLAYDEAGISWSARQRFYETLQAFANRYHFPLVDFQEHDRDPTFLVGHRYHLSETGWMAYNYVLNDFFHDRQEPDKPKP